TLEAAEETPVAKSCPQHAGREIEGDHTRPAVAAFELGRHPAGAGTEVQDDLGMEIEGREAANELFGHPQLQHGRGYVGDARTIESRAHARFLELEGVGVRQAEAGGRKSVMSAPSCGRCERNGACAARRIST